MTRPELIRDALDFDDVGLLAADKSYIRSRKNVSVSTNISKNCTIKYPIISSPMDTISDVDTCIALNKIGAAGVLHRFMSIDEQCKKAFRIKSETGRCYVAVNLKDYKDRVKKLMSMTNPDVIFVDSANGSSVMVEEFMSWYTKFVDTCRPDIVIGNTMTKASVSKAFNIGASGIRHGVGIGKQCLTSHMTGIQCPALTSLYYAWKAKRNWLLEREDCSNILEKGPTVLLDGGIKKPADFVKAIAAGADAVICGTLFAGCKETPGEIYVDPYKNSNAQVCDDDDYIVDNGKIYVNKNIYSRYFNSDPYENCKKLKVVRGMASLDVVEEYGLWDGKKENLFVEGKKEYVEYTGKSVVDIVYEYVNGLRSAMSYLNFSTLDELKGSMWNGKCDSVRIVR